MSLILENTIPLFPHYFSHKYLGNIFSTCERHGVWCENTKSETLSSSVIDFHLVTTKSVDMSLIFHNA